MADPVLIALLKRCGIRHDTTVVLYAGVEDVRLLDGGYAAWIGLALPLERRLPAAATSPEHDGDAQGATTTSPA